jgi:4-amino-4-deoxy-L-arabinose transferase-like glycosyltransferase
MRRPLLASPAALAALAVGLALRLWFLALTPNYFPQRDDLSYLRYALSIDELGHLPVFVRQGVLEPTAYRAPGFPFFLAAVHHVFGGYIHPLRVGQAVVGVALIAAIGFVADELAGRRAALAAMALAAVSPVLIAFGGSLMSEPLYALLLTSSLALALRARTSPRWVAWAIGAGVTCGAAALTRPAGLLVLPAVALAAVPARARWPAGAAVLLAGVLVIAPWTARNMRVLHAFVPISTETGNTLAGTYNDQSLHDRARPASWRDPVVSGLYPKALAKAGPSEQAIDRELLGASLDWISHHPAYVLKVAYYNGRRMAGLYSTKWSADSLGFVSLRPRPGFALAVRLGLLVAFVLGLAGSLTRPARAAPIGWWLAGLAVLVTAIFVNGVDRFAFPLQPWLLVLAGMALAAVRVPPGPRLPRRRLRMPA